MDIFLARQPIFGTKEDVYAYEIFYRSGLVNAYDGIDGDHASRSVIFNAFQTFGIQTLTNGKPVFINFTENLINDETATLFPKDQLIVEILETVEAGNEVVKKSKILKDLGYKIALDDFIYTEDYENLIKIADIIKIDFLQYTPEEILVISQGFKKTNVILLAEKVETRELFDFAKKLGFSLFQGYFFSKPEIMKSKKLKPIKSTYLQLVNQVNKENRDFDFKEIAKIITRDLSLSYNLLKLVNSPAFGFRQKIRSIKHGVVALGERELRKWIHLVVVNDMGEGRPDELTRLSLIRARFLELLAAETDLKGEAENIFLIGLFSLLDVILNKPMESVLEEIQAAEIIRQALLNKSGPGASLYKLVIAYEKGQWDQVIHYGEELKIDSQNIINAYFDCLVWYKNLINNEYSFEMK